MSLVPDAGDHDARGRRRRRATASSTACCSPSVMVGDSPVVPETTRPSCAGGRPGARPAPAPRRGRSSRPRNGVTIAVSTRPNGAGRGRWAWDESTAPGRRRVHVSVASARKPAQQAGAARVAVPTTSTEPSAGPVQLGPGSVGPVAQPDVQRGCAQVHRRAASTSVTTATVGVRQEGRRPPPADHPARSSASPSASVEPSTSRPLRPTAGLPSGRRWSGRAAAGSGAGSDSQVRRPMTTVEPMVSARNSPGPPAGARAGRRRRR